jgi:hypothetical protein
LYDRTRKMWIFKTGDCLIEVTTWAGLTVKTNDNKPAQISQHKIKTNHLEHHLCLLPLLEDVWGNLKYTIIYRVESGIKHHNSNLFLSCHTKFHINWTSLKRPPVLKDHLFFVPRVTP